jgi:hypothetical protein
VAVHFLCWFPFHLLMLPEAGPDLEDVWVLLRPLVVTLVGTSGWLNPLLCV